MSPVGNLPDGTDLAHTPSGWLARLTPASRRRRHAEEERTMFVRSVVMRSEVIGTPVPMAVEGWTSAMSLAWLQEHRNDPPVQK